MCLTLGTGSRVIPSALIGREPIKGENVWRNMTGVAWILCKEIPTLKCKQ